MVWKIDNGSVAYQKITKSQTISSEYLLNRYAKECDVIKVGWLPIIERFEFNATKLALKALHCLE